MALQAKNRIDGKREPNGRLSKKRKDVEARAFAALDRQERDTLETGLSARERVYGLPRTAWDQKAGKHIAVSRDPRASTFVGRLCMGKELSNAQYEAAMLYAEDCENYARAVHAPRQPGAVDLNATKGGNGDYENVAKTKRIVARYKVAHDAVQAAQNELRGRATLFAALYEIVLRDRECFHLVGDAKQALNALGRYYGLLTP